MHLMVLRDELGARFERPLSKRLYVVTYGMMFLLMFLGFAGGLILKHHGFIYSIDGVSQQYPFFLLEGEWLRALIKNIFVLHTLQVPQWTNLLGYGTDYMTALSSYTGNPFYLLAVFSNPQNGELLLTATIPMQLACASVIFTRCCRYHGMGRFDAMVGGLAYAFSGFAVNACTQVPFMLWVMAAPLVLLGVDKVIDRKNPVTFIVGMALCFLNSVSLSYQVCLLLVVYCLARFFCTFPNRTPRTFLLLFVRVVIPLTIGAMIGMVLFLPVAMSILGETRLGVSRGVALLFPLRYYRYLFSSLLVVSWPGVDGTPVGSLALSSLCATLVFALRRREHPAIARPLLVLRVLAVAFLALLLFPVPSGVLNGMSYPSLRWAWAVSLLMGYATALLSSRLGRMSRDERVRMLALWVVLMGACVVAGRRDPSWALIVSLALVSLLFLCMPLMAGGLRVRQALVSTSLVASCVALFGGYFIGGGFSQTVAFNTTYAQVYGDTPLSVLDSVDATSAGRYALRGAGAERNMSAVSGIPGDSFYNSLYNNHMDEFLTSLGLISHTNNFSWEGFDARYGLEALSGVDYLVAPNDPADALYPPKGYSFVGPTRSVPADGPTGERTYGVYAAQAATTLGSLHSTTYARATYDSLNMVQRQNLLLSGVVLEGARATDSPAPSDLGISMEESLPLDTATVQEDPSAAAVSAREVVVAQSHARISLSTHIPAGKKAYLVLKGLTFEGRGMLDTHAFVQASSGSAAETVMQANIQETWYGNKHDWVCDLDTSSQDRTSVSLSFDVPGRYGLESIGVVLEDEDVSLGLAEDFANEGPTSLAFDANDSNAMSGKVDVAAADGQMLLVRVPYDKGWSATVDGAPVEIERADVGFMAIHLGQGSHDVVLEYRTPYLAVGTCVSALGVVLAIGYCRLLASRRRSNASTQGASQGEAA